MPASKKLFIFMVHICIVFPSGLNLYAQTMHVIIFAATSDTEIGGGNTISYQNLLTEVDRVRINTGMDVVFYPGNSNKPGKNTPKNFNTETANQVISAVNCEANDVVLFYFIGHGYQSILNETPNLIFKNSQSSAIRIG